MRKQSYEPSFLISAQIPQQLHKELAAYAKSMGVSEEDIYRKALKFYAAKCVHTHSGRNTRRPH